MDFMEAHHAVLAAHARTMHLSYSIITVALHAHFEGGVPEFESAFIALCTFQQYAADVKQLPDEHVQQAFMECATPQMHVFTADPAPRTDDP